MLHFNPMKRYLFETVSRDLHQKMVMLTGPRQVGKTHLAREIMRSFPRPQYLNYDSVEDMRLIHERRWLPSSDLIVIDEVHKMREWKGFLKGVFDTRPEGQAILVTGSARMDTWRQSGESLAGRYYRFHLHPLSVRELAGQMEPEAALDALIRLGGFPEPFLSSSETEVERWRIQYATDLVREDVMDFSRVHEIRHVRLLLDMLRRRTGSPLSCASLARDLQLAPNTVRRYLEILESLHIVFLVRPHHRNIARAVLKEPKVYFYDNGMVEGDEGARLENACAAALLKHADYLRDVRGEEVTLRYVRDAQGHEVDFALARGEELEKLIEVKNTESRPANGLAFFASRNPEVLAEQWVRHVRQEQVEGPVRILRAARALADLAA